MVAEGQLYARIEHGGYPVHLLQTGYRVEWPSGPREYPSARKMIIALTARNPEPPKSAPDPHLTFDRYFRRGRYQRQKPLPEVDVFTLFRPDPPNQVAIQDEQKVLAPEEGLAVHEPALGIDLAKRGIEVRKLFYSQFAKKVLRRGYDPADVLQELYKGLLVRNEGKCPFDPRKSSFAHYVIMVAGCIWSNYQRRYSRLERNEVFGVTNLDGEREDVAQADLVVVEPEQEEAQVLDDLTTDLTTLAAGAAEREGRDPTIIERCVEFLILGMKQKEMAQVLKCKSSVISEAIRFIRRIANEWRTEALLVT